MKTVPTPEDFQMLNMLLCFQPIGEVTTFDQAAETMAKLGEMAIEFNTMVYAWVKSFQVIDQKLNGGEIPDIPAMLAVSECGMIASVWQNQAAQVLDHDLAVMSAFFEQFGPQDAQRPE